MHTLPYNQHFLPILALATAATVAAAVIEQHPNSLGVRLEASEYTVENITIVSLRQLEAVEVAQTGVVGGLGPAQMFSEALPKHWETTT